MRRSVEVNLIKGGMQNACTLSLLFFSSSDRFCEKILSHERPTNQIVSCSLIGPCTVLTVIQAHSVTKCMWSTVLHVHYSSAQAL